MKILYTFVVALWLSSSLSAQVQEKEFVDPNAPRPYAAVPTARPSSEIKATFPYDIKVANKQRIIAPSDSVFATDKPVVLAFWLTTCMPCKHELQAYAKNYEAWKKEVDFDLYAISIDFPNRHEAFYSEVLKNNYPFASYLDVNREFLEVMPGELNGLPQVFILNKGEIVYHHRRYRPGDENALFAKLKEVSAMQH